MNKQSKRVLDYINRYGSITQFDALKHLGVARLAARVKDLRDAGVPIVTEMESDTNMFGEIVSYARYKIVKA